MALQTKTYSTGSLAYGSDSKGYVLDLILTEQSVDVAANTSRVAYKLQLRSGHSNRFDWELTGRLSLGGQPVAESTQTKYLDYNSVWTILSGEETLAHEPDGTGTLTFAARLTPYGGGTPYTPPEMTLAGEFSLTDIPRESTISATGAYIEESLLIALARQSDDHTHSIHYRFGTLSGYVQDAAGRLGEEEAKLSATTVVLPIPESFYTQIPDAPCADLILTCVTYAGATPVGQPTTATCRITADPARCAPVVTGTAEDINPLTLALTGDPQSLVCGASHVLCALTATAQKGATVTRQLIDGVEGDHRTIENATRGHIPMGVYDSRGYYTEYAPPALKTVPYFPVTGVAAARRDAPTADTVTVTVSGKYFPGNFGLADNALTVRCRAGQDSWVSATADLSGDTYTATVTLSGLDYQTSHTLQLEVSDKLTSLTKTLTVGRGVPVFDWGEADFAFHVPVQLKSGLSPMGQNTVMGESGYLFTGNADDIKDNAFLLTGEGVQNCPSDNGFLLVFGWKRGTLQVAFQICGNFQASILQCRVYWYDTWRDWFNIPTQSTS